MHLVSGQSKSLPSPYTEHMPALSLKELSFGHIHNVSFTGIVSNHCTFQVHLHIIYFARVFWPGDRQSDFCCHCSWYINHTSHTAPFSLLGISVWAEKTSPLSNLLSVCRVSVPSVINVPSLLSGHSLFYSWYLICFVRLLYKCIFNCWDLSPWLLVMIVDPLLVN